MVRRYNYRGETFTATVHGKPGKEEIFIVMMLEDDEEGPEISIDRFEDADNDPEMGLEDAIVKLTDKLIAEQSLDMADPAAGFAWIEARIHANVHNGIQH